MRFCRFGDGRLGVVDGSNVRDVTPALEVLPTHRYPLPSFDPFIANLDRVAQRAREILAHAPVLPLSSLKLLSPVANPGKIIGAPVNYQKHLDEARADPEIHNNKEIVVIQRIGVFLKAVSSLVGPSQSISIIKPDRRTDHEVE